MNKGTPEAIDHWNKIRAGIDADVRKRLAEGKHPYLDIKPVPKP